MNTKTRVLIGVAAVSLAVGLAGTARADDVRHSPDAHMTQNERLYTYEYDDGVCWYHYEYDFKTLKDRLDQRGDCRNVPIARYRPQAAIAPAYPPPAAAPPIGAPGMPAPVTAVPQAAPSVTVGPPTAAPPRAPAGISVAPMQ